MMIQHPSLQKAYKKALIKALKVYWGYRPKAKNGMNFTRKQMLHQSQFHHLTETIVDGKSVTFEFMGEATWAFLKLPLDQPVEQLATHWFAFRISHMHQLAHSNGIIEVPLPLLVETYNAIQTLIIDYVKCDKHLNYQAAVDIKFKLKLDDQKKM